jgi:4-amino-4-deoxy-L-arabinose transferase-like glycosyltransferase
VLSTRNHALFLPLILFLAALLRFGPIFSGLPYSDYIDEGFVIHQATNVLKNRSFDVRWYGYPSLPAYLTVATMAAASPIYRHFHGHSFRRDLPRDETFSQPFAYNYDLISPREFIVAGRLLAAGLSTATVVLVGLLAARLRGGIAGAMAMLLASVCPALVLRASNVIVDTFACFFVTLTLYLCDQVRLERRPGWSVGWAAAAGLAAGASFACKYTAGVVFVAVLASIFFFRTTKTQCFQLTATASLGLCVGIVLCVPGIIFKWQSVARDLATTAIHYATIVSDPGYFGQAVSPYELGWPLILAGCAGIGVAFRQKSTRWVMAAWSLFAILSIAVLLQKSFQPFRNVLQLVPLFCVAGGVALAKAFTSLPLPRRWLRIAVAVIVVGVATSSMGFHSIRSLSQRMAHRDSRVQAIDWLRQHTNKNEKVLALQELAILPEEWQRVPATSSIVSFVEASHLLDREHFDYVVTGELDQRFAENPESVSQNINRWREKNATFAVQAEFGSGRTFVIPFVWRTNDERIVIRKVP